MSQDKDSFYEGMASLVYTEHKYFDRALLYV